MGVGCDFYAACREPGVVRLHFPIPYEARIGSLIQGQAVPDGVILGRPLGARVWVFDLAGVALAGSTHLAPENGGYIPLS